ncbi:unnamed protein product [Owenia fusiformis]|uniref:Uncharacterized protein n=1 Tax=Owenia fusiformis TaxID=6347 RepID=A0A8J1YB89_OWEFU|nr:unnamed protein product [Owenia fusiformis]
MQSEAIKGHTEMLERHRFKSIPGESILAKELFDLINATMNPENCTSAKYLLCEWTRGAPWGLGSMIHLILACLPAAVATHRVLRLNSATFRPESWETYLLPPSDTCANHPLTDIQDWSTIETPEKSLVNTLRITLPDKGPKKSLHLFTAFSVPPRFAGISKKHRIPELWMVGQYVRYLIQPTKKLRQFISNVVSKIGFRTPVVGLHIRRGDKVREVKPTPLNKYFDEINQYFLTRNYDTKLVFLATDDKNVFNDCRDKYKQYTFIQLESDKTKRTNTMVTLTDIILLAETDYFVGTFSSNVGLLVHELRQQRYKDGSCMSKSTDVTAYHFMTCCNIGAMKFLSRDESNLGVLQHCSLEHQFCRIHPQLFERVS